MSLFTRYFRFLAIAILTFALAGCFHVQIQSGVGGAVVTITPLDDEGNVIAMATSADPQTWIDFLGQEAWDGLPDDIQLALIGIANISANNLESDTLYLVTATGGMDYDADGDGVVDSVPTPISGEVRSVVTGAQVADSLNRLSPLTEALYQLVKDDIGTASAADIQAALDAAAAVLVGDTNDDGQVDASDVAFWTYWFPSELYLGDSSAFSAMVDAITTGADDASRASVFSADLSGIVIGGGGGDGWELTVSGSFQSSLITTQIPETTISIAESQVPLDGDTAPVEAAIQDLASQSGASNVANIQVTLTSSSDTEIVMTASFNATLTGLGDVTYNVIYTYTDTSGGSGDGDSGGDGGSDGGSNGGSDLPVAGQVVTMTFCCGQPGVPYTDGSMSEFVFSSSGALFVDNTEIASSFTVGTSREYIWADSANDLEWRLFFTSDGAINEVNLHSISSGNFLGQFSP